MSVYHWAKSSSIDVMASTIFFSFAMSFLLVENILLKSGLPDFGAEARLPSQPYSPALNVTKAIRSLLIAAIKGTEWLNFGGTTLLNQNLIYSVSLTFR